MRCPTCGQEIEHAGATSCPSCGATLPMAGMHAVADAPAATGAANPAAPTVAPATGAPPPAPWFAGGAALGTPPGAPAQYPYAPSAGMPPYPAAYPAAYMPPMAPYPPAPAPADPARRKRLVLIITAIVAAVVIVCGGGLAALAIYVHQANTLLPETVIYQNSLQGFPGGFANGDFCTYGSDGYHVRNGHQCYAEAVDPQRDVAVTVTVTQTAGLTNFGYGIILRATKGANGHEYVFMIAGGGDWAFDACDAQTCHHVSAWRASDAIHTGLNATNTIKVHAQGSRFTFFINQTQVGTATDFAYTAVGQVGLIAFDYVQCVFTNIIVARVG